ncbi:MAG TPA: hypothetical protein VKV39_06285 [Candidatus Sulfotelmatobacter sp.]|nr:hypothetical protein [Candidatus Sulfotelmatobacter sp.]
MAARAFRIIFRIIFAICGLITLFNAVPYALLRGVDLPYQSEWIFFVLVLGFFGFCALLAAVLPRSWIAKAVGTPDDEFGYRRPLKLLGVGVGLGYIVALCAYSAPHSWDLSPQVMLMLCPLYLVKMTFDPSPAQLLLLLAPINAAVYGSLGLSLAYGWRALHR